MDELQAGIKIGGRNINNLRYVDDTTLMSESEKEQNSLLMRVKEESDMSLALSKYSWKGKRKEGKEGGRKGIRKQRKEGRF